MRAVLFDMDGTIADTSRGVFRCLGKVFDAMDIKVPEGFSLRKCIGPPLSYTFPVYFGLDREDTARAEKLFRQEYYASGVYECELFEGMKECVAEVKRRGYFTTVASSKPEVMCQKILKQFGIEELFDVVAGADPERHIDTKEEVLYDLFGRISDIKKEDMLLVGDSIFDAEGAKNTGIKCLAVEYGFGDADDMVKSGAVGKVGTTAEIPDAVDEYLKKRGD